MRFYDDGVAGRECGNRVATRNRKRERKIARPKNDDRADGDQHAPQVRLGYGLPVGDGVVDPRVNPGAVPYYLGKKSELPDRAAAFSG